MSHTLPDGVPATRGDPAQQKLPEMCRVTGCGNTSRTHVLEGGVCGECRDGMDRAGMLYEFDVGKMSLSEAIDVVDRAGEW